MGVHNPTSVKTTQRIVSVAVAGEAMPRHSKAAMLWHAAELDANDTPIRVLCKRVKLEHILDDATLYNNHPVSCPQCVAAVRRLAK